MEHQDSQRWKLFRQLSRLRQRARNEKNPKKLIEVLNRFNCTLRQAEKLCFNDEHLMQESPFDSHRNDPSRQKSWVQ